MNEPKCSAANYRERKSVMARFSDITERKKIEELTKSNERLRILFDFAPDAYFLFDLEGNFVDGNKAVEQLTGYSNSELIGKNLLMLGLLLPASQIPWGMNLLANIALGKSAGPEYFILNRKDETQVSLEIRMLPAKIQGQTLILGIARDITEHKQVEEALQESKDELQTLYECLVDGLLIADMGSTKFLRVNPSGCAMFGYSEAEFLTKGVEDIFPPDKVPLIVNHLVALVWGQERIAAALPCLRKDGKIFFADMGARRVTYKGRPCLIGFFHDITKRKLMEEKLEEYSKHLEELVETRTAELKAAQQSLVKAERLAAIGQLAGMVGHDLRNPLQAMRNAVYCLRTELEPSIGKNAGRMLDIIEKDLEYSNKIVNDLLEYSREIRLELVEISPKSIITEALSAVRIPANIQVLDLTRNERKVMVDAAKMRRVFINIINNAIDAMPEGGRLALKAQASSDSVEFAFTDTGTGMTKEVMERIWTPLFTTKARGMGFGLPICKRIVEAHEGKITFNTRVGQGTTFTVTIPINPSRKEQK